MEGKEMEKKKFSTKYLTCIGMFCAIAYVAMLIGNIVPKISGFLSYDPKDAVIAIAGFIFGPLACVFTSVIVSFIEMITVSTTGPYGLLMNIISTCAFAVPAAWLYRKHRTHKGAVAGLALGTVIMVACMIVWNYIITPFYMGVDRAQVAAMLVPVFLPFNLVKGGINAGLTLLLYKPIVDTLRKAKLVEPSQSGRKGSFNVGYTLFAAAVVVTFALLFLVLAGII